MARSRRFRRPVTVAYIDVDDFKSVNDRFGHREGDELLRALAATMLQAVRETDLVARMGGDEFVILLPETDTASARRVMQRLTGLVHTRLEHSRWPVSISVGVVTFRECPGSVAELLNWPDRLMYAAKRQGKRRVLYEIRPDTGAFHGQASGPGWPNVAPGVSPA
jgi:diguanylate cyclase (GGDEF)-like protein